MSKAGTLRGEKAYQMLKLIHSGRTLVEAKAEMKAVKKMIMKDIKREFKKCDADKNKVVDADEFKKCVEDLEHEEGHDTNELQLKDGRSPTPPTQQP